MQDVNTAINPTIKRKHHRHRPSFATLVWTAFVSKNWYAKLEKAI
ncbi:hypothetical protein [Pediococcus parvulus]|nr:hypothetical protein [Pediococcus parvulus]